MCVCVCVCVDIYSYIYIHIYTYVLNSPLATLPSRTDLSRGSGADEDDIYTYMYICIRRLGVCRPQLAARHAPSQELIFQELIFQG